MTFLDKIRAVGERQYHDKHPFHVAMNAGQLSPEAIRGWVANRFYYQQKLPQKDAFIIANCPVVEVRRLWLHRIDDHDGVGAGIERWLRLVQACGADTNQVLPAVRETVDSYLEFARSQPWQVAVASSLTELFAPVLMRERIAAFAKHYTWIEPTGLMYFRKRARQARVDSQETIDIVMKHCDTAALQEGAVAAVEFKCCVLWKMLDAIQAEYPR